MDGQLDAIGLGVSPGAGNDRGQRSFVAAENDQLARIEDRPEVRCGLGPVLHRRIDEMDPLVARASQSLDLAEGIVSGLIGDVRIENLEEPRCRTVLGHGADESESERAAIGLGDPGIDQRLDVKTLAVEQDHDGLMRLPAGLRNPRELTQPLHHWKDAR